MSNSKKINIRPAHINDIDQLARLFRDTITTINTKDYNEEQIKAWSGTIDNTDRIKAKLEEQYFIVAEIENVLVGFSSLTSTGYLDYMFTHKSYQGIGIASGFVSGIKAQAIKWGLKEITTDASITAKTFFEKHGFKTIRQQSVYIIDVMLTNYKMYCTINGIPV